MITFYLKFDDVARKHVVDSWHYSSKQQAAEIKEVPGQVVHLAPAEVPQAFFFANMRDYFIEDRKLRKLYRVVTS